MYITIYVRKVKIIYIYVYNNIYIYKNVYYYFYFSHVTQEFFK